MKTKPFRILVTCLIFLHITGYLYSNNNSNNKNKIVVFPFTENYLINRDTTESYSFLFAQLLISSINNRYEFSCTEIEKITDVLDEQKIRKLNKSNNNHKNKIFSISKIMKCDYAIIGEYGLLGNDYFIVNIWLFDIIKRKVIDSIELKIYKIDNKLEKQFDDMAKRILQSTFSKPTYLNPEKKLLSYSKEAMHLYIVGLNLYINKEYSKAVKIIQNALDKDPEFNLAKILLRRLRDKLKAIHVLWEDVTLKYPTLNGGLPIISWYCGCINFVPVIYNFRYSTHCFFVGILSGLLAYDGLEQDKRYINGDKYNMMSYGFATISLFSIIIGLIEKSFENDIDLIEIYLGERKKYYDKAIGFGGGVGTLPKNFPGDNYNYSQNNYISDFNSLYLHVWGWWDYYNIFKIGFKLNNHINIRTELKDVDYTVSIKRYGGYWEYNRSIFKMKPNSLNPFIGAGLEFNILEFQFNSSIESNKYSMKPYYHPAIYTKAGILLNITNNIIFSGIIKYILTPGKNIQSKPNGFIYKYQYSGIVYELGINIVKEIIK